MNASPSVRAEAARAAPDSALQPALRECVARAVRRYLADLGDHPADGLYQLLLDEVEQPLLKVALDWYAGNQSKTAAALGINRATLRKKLAQHGLG